MATSYASGLVPASADRTWAAVRDFGGLADWHPAIASSEIEDGGPAEVGCVRHLVLTDDTVLRERLRLLDDEERAYAYDFVQSAYPVRNYLATLRVRPVTVTGQAFVEWYARYDAEAADEFSMEEFFRGSVFEPGLRNLESRLGG